MQLVDEVKALVKKGYTLGKRARELLALFGEDSKAILEAMGLDKKYALYARIVGSISLVLSILAALFRL